MKSSTYSGRGSEVEKQENRDSGNKEGRESSHQALEQQLLGPAVCPTRDGPLIGAELSILQPGMLVSLRTVRAGLRLSKRPSWSRVCTMCVAVTLNAKDLNKH